MTSFMMLRLKMTQYNDAIGSAGTTKSLSDHCRILEYIRYHISFILMYKSYNSAA